MTSRTTHRPLEQYGVIGDMRTLAVVGSDASIDWMCWPRFDSPSIFGALLDADGGRWSIELDDGNAGQRQVYLSGTNVLVTRFHAVDGLLEVEDLMAVGPGDGRWGGGRHVVRVVRCLRGSADVSTTISARPDYGRSVPALTALDDGSASIAFGTEWELVASGGVDWSVDGDDLHARFSVDEDDEVHLVLGESPLGPSDAAAANADAVRFWRSWAATTRYTGRWREAVERSALVLKMLTHEPSGGIVAAGTTSLPERLGGARNWDYRYVWIRDAAFTLYALIALGHLDEARAFTAWLGERMEACPDRVSAKSPPLAPLYTLDGDSQVDEQVLEHWSGYLDSRPVRIGNAASDQFQLDIYGELVDAMYLADKYGDGASIDTWGHLRTIVDWVVDNWQMADDGMWEARCDAQRYTSSLMMCWVAVERAIRMARRRGRPAPLVRWLTARDEIYETLIERGYNADRRTFTQLLDGDTLDASILLAPLVKLLSPTDPRWLDTLDAIAGELAHGPLVDRYDQSVTDDGLDGAEGSFTICSFWYVEALARSGRVDEARELFDRLLSYAGPTGIFSEEIGPDGRMLGNLPQAFTHLSLISAALALDHALDVR